MEFSKYEATANDFIMLDRMSGGPLITPGEVRLLCDRRTGIGADGVIEMLPSVPCDIRMRISNADGSEAQMCGNGTRALFLFALDRGITNASEISVQTPAGTRTVKRSGNDGAAIFTVGMGLPAWSRSRIPMLGAGDDEAIRVPVLIEGDVAVEATCVSMGNPHCVVFTEKIEMLDISAIGPAIETNALFPERTNVEFVNVVNEANLEVRVWERGVGETMACGTGACASVVAASLLGLAGRQATAHLKGGALEVQWRKEGVFLSSPARHVFDGKTVG